RYGYNQGLVDNLYDVYPLSKNPTLPGILTAHGYQTRAQGKMHFAPLRANSGFEHMELPMEYYRERRLYPEGGLPKEHGVGENEVEPVISTVDEVHSLTHWTVRRSIEFLETRDDTRPFFLWTSFTKPHPPFDPCANYWALYQNAEIPSPVLGDWSEDIHSMPQGLLASTYSLSNMYRLSEKQQENVRRAYYACITQIDYSLGLLFARMRELGLLKNTWIIFTSDHGDMQGDHHMGGKSVFLEGSAHVPMIVCPPEGVDIPGLSAGSRYDGLVAVADIMPTFLNLAGAVIPEHVDGMDLLGQASNGSTNRILFGNSCDRYYAVIGSRYKYMWCKAGGAEQLFDLEKDPMEQHELIAAGTHRETAQSMRGQLIEFLEKQNNPAVCTGELVTGPALSGPEAVGKWPGLISTQFPCDVLH
ncbi:MAG: sulfatase-like hydrolase/transferase, partial [Kiritimatiellales bacterium]